MTVQFTASALATRSRGHLSVPPLPSPERASASREAGHPGSISTDTRTIAPGQWFLALEGAKFNGHDYLQTALDRGAAGCVVSRRWFGSGSATVQDVKARTQLVVVDDTSRALQDLAHSVRLDLPPSTPVVGITGSAGKTSTKGLTALALSPLGLVHKTEGNFNNLVGLPLTLLASPEPLDSVKALVLEMGMNCPGEIRRLAEIAEPTVRLITNVGPAHLEGCGGTVEGVARCKGELFETARPLDTLIVNDDDRLVSSLLASSSSRKVIRFGSSPSCDLQLLSTRFDSESGRTLLDIRDNLGGSGNLIVALKAAGLVWGPNVTAAMAVAAACDVPLSKAASALESFQPASMRMQVHRLEPLGATLIDDSYNANPLSMRLAIQTAFQLAGPSDRPVLCLGDMRELGPSSADLHAEILQTVSTELDQRPSASCSLFLVGPSFAQAVSGHRWGRRRPDLTECFENSAQLAAKFPQIARGRDVILVKGSRGTAMDAVSEKLLTL